MHRLELQPFCIHVYDHYSFIIQWSRDPEIQWCGVWHYCSNYLLIWVISSEQCFHHFSRSWGQNGLFNVALFSPGTTCFYCGPKLDLVDSIQYAMTWFSVLYNLKLYYIVHVHSRPYVQCMLVFRVFEFCYTHFVSWPGGRTLPFEML